MSTNTEVDQAMDDLKVEIDKAEVKPGETRHARRYRRTL